MPPWDSFQGQKMTLESMNSGVIAVLQPANALLQGLPALIVPKAGLSLPAKSQPTMDSFWACSRVPVRGLQEHLEVNPMAS
jgi:hypothetical protein